MKALVTGGAGFIGSNLVRVLRNKYGFAVTVLDDLFTGDLNNLRGISENIEFIEGSILDTELLRYAVQDKQLVFHLAARNIIVSSQDPLTDLAVNAQGTLKLLQACQQIGDSPKIVYASTASIYGTADYLPIPETAAVNPSSFYAVSKFAGEGYCGVFSKLYGLPVTILRYSNVYGYNQTPANPYCGVIGKFLERSLENEPLLIHGDGEQTRDFTFVEDAAEATVLAALSEQSAGRIYNVGTGVETSINQLAQLIIQATDSSSGAKYIEHRDIDNIQRRVLNADRMQQELSFVPRFDLEAGLKFTIDWFKENRKNGGSSN